MSAINELDVIALLEDIETEHWETRALLTLPRGSVGTVMLEFNQGEAYEVEFSGKDGRTVALVALKPKQFLVLRYDHPIVLAA